MKKLFILLLIAIALMLSSCVIPLKEGTITKLIFTPEHREAYESYEYDAFEGKYHYVTRYRTVHDKWEIRVEGIVVNKKGETIKVINTVTVTQPEYSSFDLGQHVVIRDDNNNLILGK